MAKVFFVAFKALSAFLVLSSVLFSDSVYAEKIRYDTFCYISCQTAIGRIAFGGSPTLLDGFYPYQCQNQLFLSSTYACTKKYCTEDDYEPGLEYAAESCEVGLFPMLQPHTPDQIYSVDLSNVTVVPFGDFTVYNSTAVPDEISFDLSYRTIVSSTLLHCS